MTRAKRLSTVGTVAVALLLTGCGGRPTDPGASASPTASTSASTAAESTGAASTGAASTSPTTSAAPTLAAFADCAELTEHLHKVAPAHAAANAPYADDNPFRGDVRTTDTRGRMFGGSTAPPTTAPPTTDTAVPDMVATDGRLLVSALDGRLNVVDVSGRKPRILGGVDTPGHGNSRDLVLLIGDHVLLLSPADPAAIVYGLGPPGSQPVSDRVSDLTLVDLHDPTRPTILGTEAITGRIVGTQRTGDVVRVALTTDPGNRLARTGGIGLKRNRVFVANTTAADWLPDRRIVDGQGRTVASGPLVECSDVRRPAQDSGLEVLTILTMDPSRDDALTAAHAVGVLAGGDLVAASASRLFLATVPGWGSRTPPQKPRTEVHAFDLTSPTATAYLGSGELTDYVAGVGALSARDDVLRAVTTKNPPWNRPYTGRRDGVGVAVVTERGGTLRTVGTVTGLAEKRRWKVLRWFDDVLALAPDPKIPSNSSHSDEAGPFDLVSLDPVGGPRRLGTLDLPQQTAELIALGGDRILAVGLRSGLPPLSDTSLEVGSLDLEEPGDGRQADLVSFGRGSIEGWDAVTWLPDRRLLILQGYIDPYRGCPPKVRCLLTPVTWADYTSAVSLHVAADGRLQAVGWSGDDSRLGLLLRVGDRFAAVGDGVTMVDPETLKASGRVEFPPRRAS